MTRSIFALCTLPLLFALVLGCDDDPTTAPQDTGSTPDMHSDRGEPDSEPEDQDVDEGVQDMGPDAHHFARPGPRPEVATVLGERLGAVRDLALDGDDILALTRTGWLYALDGEGGQRMVRNDLPENGRLLSTSVGVLVVHEGGLLPLTDGPTIEAPGARRVVATEAALYWVDPGEEGRVVRYPLPDGPQETIASGLGAVSAVWPHADGTLTVGVGGEEPRRIHTLAADGEITDTVESRFVPEFFADIDGDVYAHMMTGAGWLERVEPDRLWRLGYVGRGYNDLQAVDGALWWHTSAALVRTVPGEAFEALRMGVNPSALLVLPDRLVWASPWREQVLSIPR